MRKIITIIILMAAFGNSKIFAQIDTACAGSSGNRYDINSTLVGATYTWSLKNNLGTIVPIAGRTDSILINFGLLAGIDTLRLIETGPSGCIGDTMKLALVILPNVTATLSGTDSICVSNFSLNKLRVAFTGSSPWSITYTDGTTPISITGITTNPYIFSSPVYSTVGLRTFSLTVVSGAGSCLATLVGTASIAVFAKPGFLSINHY